MLVLTAYHREELRGVLGDEQPLVCKDQGLGSLLGGLRDISGRA